MGYLDRCVFRNILLDISDDDDLTVAIDINGYELVGLIMPSALDGATNDITPQFDPGNGTFYTPLQNDGSAITWWANVAANEWLQVPQSISKLVGAKLKLSLSAGESADRTFIAVLVALTGDAD